MNNRNLGILIVAIIIATAAICFTIFKGNKEETAAIQNAAVEGASMTPAADPASIPAPTPEQPTADNPVVGTVDGQNILRSEVIAFMRNFPPQMQQMPVEQLFPMALEQVVTAKVVDARAAKETELQNDPEVAKRLAEAKVQIVRTVYLEKEIEKQLTDDKIQKAYDKFKAEQGKIEEVHARHILVEKEETAKEIIAKLEGGAKFEDLAKEYSKDPSNKDTGGDLGYFTKDAMVKEFADAAFAGSKGVLKTPVKTQFGFHVVEILDKRTKPVPTLEEVKPALAAEERRQILNDMVEGWRKKADVKTLDINGKPIVEKKAAEAPKEEPKK